MISDLEIHSWLERVSRRGGRGRGVILGVGDDAAIVEVAGEPWALKVDPTMEGVHFPVGFRDARAIANKAIGRAASDLAAANAEPRFALVSLELPRRVSRRFTFDLLRSLRGACARIGAALVGGHTSIGARENRLALHVTLVGPCFAAPRSRRGARPGDSILVTGSFGGSSLGKHLRPTPRIEEARALANVGIRAAIDISDGLARDLWRLARASGVAIVLDAAAIPIAPAARSIARKSGNNPLFHALEDGEDYELALAVTPGRSGRALAVARRHRFKLSIVGNCLPGRGIYLREAGGKIRPIEPGGYVQRSKPPAR